MQVPSQVHTYLYAYMHGQEDSYWGCTAEDDQQHIVCCLAATKSACLPGTGAAMAATPGEASLNALAGSEDEPFRLKVGHFTCDSRELKGVAPFQPTLAHAVLMNYK